MHDYRSNKDKGVTLIVRQNNRYGEAVAGEEVLVDAREARNPSTLSACMTIQEAEELERKRAAAAMPKPKRSAVRDAVEAGLKAIAERATERAKADAEEAEHQAAAEAAAKLAEEAADVAAGRKRSRKSKAPQE